MVAMITAVGPYLKVAQGVGLTLQRPVKPTAMGSYGRFNRTIRVSLETHAATHGLRSRVGRAVEHAHSGRALKGTSNNTGIRRFLSSPSERLPRACRGESPAWGPF
jgi:hypothetical protein